MSEQIKRIERRHKLFYDIGVELDRAYEKHGCEPWGRHEFLGVITEEFREMEAEIFKGGSVPLDREAMNIEIMQVAAMCFRYLETGDRYLDRKKDPIFPQV